MAERLRIWPAPIGIPLAASSGFGLRYAKRRAQGNQQKATDE
ncbi:hypothetical protein [Spirosoma luteolum]